MESSIKFTEKSLLYSQSCTAQESPKIGGRAPNNPINRTQRGLRENDEGIPIAYFEGRLLQCRHCDKKHQCMHNPEAADHRKGNGRQVSFRLDSNRKANFTDWMKHRVDSPQGKQIYSHRMSVIEPVFGNIGTNKKLNRFNLRGKEKVQSQ